MIDFQPNTLYVTELPKNGITKQGIAELCSKMDEMGKAELSRIAYELYDSAPSWRQWMISEKGEYVGTWAKRFAKFNYQEYSRKVPHEVMATIGEVLARHCERGTAKYFYEIASQAKWQPGDFGEYGNTSCWWGDRNDNRLGMIQDANGYSVLLYKDMEQAKSYSQKKGIARCWMYNTEKGMVIFNAYGEGLNKIAQILATQFGLSYRKVMINTPEKAQIYINQGNKNNGHKEHEVGEIVGGGGSWGLGYIIGDEAVINKMSEVNLPDFTYKDGECCECKIPLKKKNSMKDSKGRFYCKEHENLLGKCGVCGDYERKDSFREVYYRGRKVTVCGAHPVKTCEVHGPTLNDCNNVWHTSRYYCSECIEEGKKVIYCAGCKHLVEKFVVVNFTANKMKLCEPCIRVAKEAA